MKMIVKNKKTKLCALFLFFLAGVVALRGDTRDTSNYVEMYIKLQDFPWSPAAFFDAFYMEWGIGVLASLIKNLNFPVEIFFLIVSLLTFTAIVKASVAFGLSGWGALPFYLPTFFLAHQLMQIRQGFAIAFAFWCASIIFRRKSLNPLAIILAIVAILFHSVSIVPIFFALLFNYLYRAGKKYFNDSIWFLLILVVVVAACYVATESNIVLSMDRVSVYMDNDEQVYSRSISDPANLRAVFLSIVFFLFRPSVTSVWHRNYMLLLGLYIAHLGIRIGFIDFAILSGRIGSSLGFAEIFLFPMMLKDKISNSLTRNLIILIFMVSHFIISLNILVPFLIEDYFRAMQ